MASANEEKAETIAEYKSCPWCGSTDRMMGKLGKELKEQGLVGEDLKMGTTEVGGTVVDPRKQMLSASLRPGMFALRDICIGCGREITVRIEKKLVRVSLGIVPSQKQPGT